MRPASSQVLPCFGVLGGRCPIIGRWSLVDSRRGLSIAVCNYNCMCLCGIAYYWGWGKVSPSPSQQARLTHSQQLASHTYADLPQDTVEGVSTNLESSRANLYTMEGHNSLNTKSGIQVACRDDEGEVVRHTQAACSSPRWALHHRGV